MKTLTILALVKASLFFFQSAPALKEENIFDLLEDLQQYQMITPSVLAGLPVPTDDSEPAIETEGFFQYANEQFVAQLGERVNPAPGRIVTSTPFGYCVEEKGLKTRSASADAYSGDWYKVAKYETEIEVIAGGNAMVIRTMKRQTRDEEFGGTDEYFTPYQAVIFGNGQMMTVPSENVVDWTYSVDNISMMYSFLTVFGLQFDNATQCRLFLEALINDKEHNVEKAFEDSKTTLPF